MTPGGVTLGVLLELLPLPGASANVQYVLTIRTCLFCRNNRRNAVLCHSATNRAIPDKSNAFSIVDLYAAVVKPKCERPTNISLLFG
jgi:hypothetical protein